MATRARLASARATPEVKLLSPRVVLKPLVIGMVGPEAAGEGNLNGAQSFRSKSSYQG